MCVSLSRAGPKLGIPGNLLRYPRPQPHLSANVYERTYVLQVAIAQLWCNRYGGLYVHVCVCLRTNIAIGRIYVLIYPLVYP